MGSKPRYEILGRIASGDFAAVYRARDLELGREVAVKRIHKQFLSDPKQLERYWREAQLLASLQHPNVVTIYDIVRGRGWLVLELMQGSLQPATQDAPVDLDYLRVVLVCSLNALKFLHANGIIHGDVKPGNLLVDKYNRIKLGDFGLARRANSDEGSLLKGTTKYMAPELVSEQFGAVGPASDLYSLGFSAYELMCGEQFEALFPGLGMFGRDRQIAWMMWHAAPDRQMPEVQRVLEGVPDDLARVVQRLVTKDPSKRYGTADEVLADLHSDPKLVEAPPPPPRPAEEAARKAEAGKKRRMRIAAVAAMAVSLLLSAALLMPFGDAPAERPEAAERGVVREVLADDRTVVLRREDGSVVEVPLGTRDRVFIDRLAQPPWDLLPGDRAEVRYFRDAEGRSITEVYAVRPRSARGRLAKIDASIRRITMEVVEGDRRGEALTLVIPPTAGLVLNGSDRWEGRALTMGDLAVDDRLSVRFLEENQTVEATEVEALRSREAAGVVRRIDAAAGTIAVSEGEEGMLRTFSVAPDCHVAINEQRLVGQRSARPADLLPGDRVRLQYDALVHHIEAYRELVAAGRVERIDFPGRSLEVVLDEEAAVTPIRVGPQCEVTLAGEAAVFADLRPGDRVAVTHDTLGEPPLAARAIEAQRPADPRRWAIIVAVDNYDPANLPPLDHTVSDARRLRDVLVRRYGVPADQARLVINEGRSGLEQAIRGTLDRLGADDRLIVYFAGHAYREATGEAYLAPSGFRPQQAASTGVPLAWLAERLEAATIGEKLLLLDASQAVDGLDAAQQPSTAEMIRGLPSPPGRGPFRTVAAVASCSPGQRGKTGGPQGPSLFAAALAEGYSGAADADRDGRITADELFAFLSPAVSAAAAEAGVAQTPVLFRPDQRPDRLSDEAKRAIRHLASFRWQERVDREALDAAYAEGRELAGEAVEPRLIYALIFVKLRERTEAFRQLAELRVDHPELILPLEALIWLRFDARAYEQALTEMGEILQRMPRSPSGGAALDEESRRLLFRLGQLREFVTEAAAETSRPPAQAVTRFDAAVANLDPEAQAAVEEGREQTAERIAQFDRQIAQTRDSAEVARLRVERRQVTQYTQFPLEEHARRILDGMDY